MFEASARGGARPTIEKLQAEIAGLTPMITRWPSDRRRLRRWRR